MKAVLRIALAFFTLAPLQRWVNAAGLLMVGLGMLNMFTADMPRGGRGGFALVVFGAVLLVLVPTFAGGMAIRMASTRALLHLMPGGRVRLLAGATLTITLLAALGALPPMSMKWLAAVNGLGPSPGLTNPLDTFMMGWSVIALCWIVIFVASRSMLAMSLVGLLPMIGLGLAKVLVPINPAALWVLLPGVACWGLFAAWYLRTGSVTRPEFSFYGDPLGGFDATPIGRLIQRLSTPRSLPTRNEAIHHYLIGAPSAWPYMLSGAFVALILIAVQAIVPSHSTRSAYQLLDMLPYVSIAFVMMGFHAVRRARFLWMRTERDRTQLFHLAERQVLRASMTTWIFAATPVVAFTSLAESGNVTQLLLYAAIQAGMAVALCYGGMALTRNWSASDVWLCVAMFVLMIVQSKVFQPRPALSPDLQQSGLLWAAAAILLLRLHAARRWRALDWRVAKAPRPGTRLGPGSWKWT